LSSILLPVDVISGETKEESDLSAGHPALEKTAPRAVFKSRKKELIEA